MEKKRFFTFIIAYHADDRLKRIHISHTTVRFLGALCLAVLLAGALIVPRYTKLLFKLLDENKQIKFENQNYKFLTHRLDEKISSLEMVSKKLVVLSGLEPIKPSAGRIGDAPVKGYQISTVTPPSQRSNQTKRREEAITRLEERFRKLNEFYNDRFLLKAYTPSIWPVKGYQSRGFGDCVDPMTGEGDHHAGIDISAPYGERVCAPATGVVVFSGFRKDYGNLVILDHKFGITTLYAHLWRPVVRVGQRVDRHDVIGLVGSTGKSTGPHLHYEVRISNRPVNPYKFLHGERAMNGSADSNPKRRG